MVYYQKDEYVLRKKLIPFYNFLAKWQMNVLHLEFEADDSLYSTTKFLSQTSNICQIQKEIQADGIHIIKNNI